MGSNSSQSEICVENSVSAVLPAHSALMNRLGHYLVKGNVVMEWLAITLLLHGFKMESC